MVFVFISYQKIHVVTDTLFSNVWFPIYTFFLSNCLFYPQTEFSTSNGRRLQTLTEALVTASCFEAFDDGPGKGDGRVVSEEQHAYEKIHGGFLKWWYPTTMGFPTKNDHFGVFGGYHYLRKHPYIFNI